MPIAVASSLHTATAAGASAPARTMPSASYSSGSSPGAGRVDVADLEQGDPGAAVRLVEGDGLQQARAAGTSAARSRRRRAGWRCAASRRRGRPGRGRRGPGTGSASPRRCPARAAPGAAARRRFWALDSRPWMVERRHPLADAVVAVVPADLFDDVDLARCCRAATTGCRPSSDAVAGGGGHEADRLEERDDLVGRDRRPEDPLDLGHAQPWSPARPAAGGRCGRRRRGAARRRRGTSRRSSSTKRAMARSATYGSTPRSKRAEASERRPVRTTDWAMPIGSNHAISRATSVVASLISVSAPPMIAGQPDRPVVGVADEQVVGRRAGG